MASGIQLARALWHPSTSGDDYDDIGGVDYGYIDLAALRDDWRKRWVVGVGEADADVCETAAIAATPELVWALITNLVEADAVSPTLLELEILIGSITDVGSVHTCFHGVGPTNSRRGRCRIDRKSRSSTWRSTRATSGRAHPDMYGSARPVVRASHSSSG